MSGDAEEQGRRKGQPKGRDQRPLHSRVVRCALLWLLVEGAGVFLLMLGWWTQHNVTLVLDAAYALGETAAEAIDTAAAERVAGRIFAIRAEAPEAPTAEYTADEQVVVLARYDVMEEDADWLALRAYLDTVSARYPHAGEFSLVGVDAEQLVYLVSPIHRTGYAAALDKISTAGPEHYDISKPESRREGTVVLVPLGVTTEGMELAISCGYGYGGILAGERGRLAAALILIAACMAGLGARLVWIIWRWEGEEREARDAQGVG